MSHAPNRLRHAMVALSLALAALPPAGCAPEVTPCQVDGTKFRLTGGQIDVWINPVSYVRVYGGRVFNGDDIDVTVLNNGAVVRQITNLTISVEPGGANVCVRSRPPGMKGGMMDMQLVTGIYLGTFPESTQFGTYSVRMVIRDQTGTTHTLNMPVAELRWRQEIMPMFSCASTACGRYQ